MIEGTKTYLVPYESSDYGLIVKWHKDPLFDDVMSDEVREKGETDIVPWYNQFFPPQGRIFMGMAKKGSKFVKIGVVALAHIDWKNRKAELFGGIGEKEYRASGHGIDAIETVVNWSRKQLGLHRIYAIVKAHNEPAIRSLSEAGFRREGDMKDAHFQDGNFINKVMMASVPEKYTLGHKRRQ